MSGWPAAGRGRQLNPRVAEQCRQGMHRCSAADSGRLLHLSGHHATMPPTSAPAPAPSPTLTEGSLEMTPVPEQGASRSTRSTLRSPSTRGSSRPS